MGYEHKMYTGVNQTNERISKMEKTVIDGTKQIIMEAGNSATRIHSAEVLASSDKSQNKKTKGKLMQKTDSAAIKAITGSTVGKSKIQSQLKTAKPAAVINTITTELKKPAQIITRHSRNNGTIKSKGGVILDTKAIIKRMLEIAQLDTVLKLAEKLGCSAQALGNSKARKSISLALLLKFCDIYDVNVEYVLYGIKLPLVQPSAALPGEKYLMSPIGIDPGFIKSSYRLESDNLRWFVGGNNVFYLVDMSTKSIATNGKFLIFGNDYSDVLECKRMIDGSIQVEGEQQTLSHDDLQRHVTILGKAVWSGASM